MDRVTSVSMVLTFALLPGCYTTLPPHVGEGTTHLDTGQVNLSVSGAGATFDVLDNKGTYASTTAFGVEARVRAGIGAKSEVGFSLIGGLGTAVGSGDPPFAVGGALSYKFAPLPRLAFVVDVGAMDANVASVAVVGGDVAVITAPYADTTGRQLYVAAKVGVVVAIVPGATNTNEALVIPFGLQIPMTERTKVNIEAGPIFGFAQQGPTSSTHSYGAYTSFTFTFGLRR